MPSSSRELNNRVVLVTGGGRGIGAATARALARRGARVAIGDVDAEAARAVSDEGDGAILPLALDVTDRPGFTAAVDEVEQRLGPLDVLVNNAGIMPIGRVEAEADATAVRQIEINLHAVIHGTKEAVRRMRPRGSGHIVNVASAAGRAGMPGAATYCATKFGVYGFSEAVRGELRGSGVEVSVVMPAIVRTELAAGLQEARGVRSVAPEDVAEAIVRTIERPRFDVFVPRSAGPIDAIGQALPRRAREALARALRIDRVLLEAAGTNARIEYEARARREAS